MVALGRSVTRALLHCKIACPSACPEAFGDALYARTLFLSGSSLALYALASGLCLATATLYHRPLYLRRGHRLGRRAKEPQLSPLRRWQSTLDTMARAMGRCTWAFQWNAIVGRTLLPSDRGGTLGLRIEVLDMACKRRARCSRLHSSGPSRRRLKDVAVC